MARTRTLIQLRADVCDRADIIEGDRHPTAQLNRRINQAIQQFRRTVTECGCDYYLARIAMVTSASTTPNASGWAPCDYLPLPADFYHLVGIDMIPNNGGNLITMQNFMRVQRNEFQEYSSETSGIHRTPGIPLLYRISGYLRNVITYDDTQIVQLIPRADAVYNCTIWYLPIAKDLTVDADPFDGVAGYEEWVVNLAALDSLKHDGLTNQALYGQIQNENEALKASMAQQFGATEGGAERRVDTYAMRRSLGRINRWRYGR